jgi:peptidoglycan/xylan/chitin deacetylase (PgdA/CDA1 family)
MVRAAAVVAGLVVALVGVSGPAVARPVGPTAPPPVASPCPRPQPLQVWKVPAHQAMLTFDDGPNPVYTPIALKILARAHVHATFFLIGKNAAAYPDLVRRIVASGNVIGNHSWDHANLARLTPARLAYEIDHTDAVLTAITGHKPCFFRFPYGSATPAAIAAVNARGMTPYIWTVDTRDWTGASTALIESTVWRELWRSHGAVILQHDVQGPQTLHAVPAVIAGLRARGYSFITPAGGKPQP